jgi:hypothetical protein
MKKDSDEDNVVSFSEFKAKAIDESHKSDLVDDFYDEEEISELSFELEELFPALGDILPAFLANQMHDQNETIETLKYLNENSFMTGSANEDDDSDFFQPDAEIETSDVDVFEPLLNCLSSLHAEMVSTELSIKDDKVWEALSNIDKEISALSKFCTKWRNR